ncbi:hypothetical protein LQT54_23320 (plasmid) [Escherichia coli]|nr:hypothetical protein [Escherichia coli]
MMDDALLAGETCESEETRQLGNRRQQPQSQEAYGCMLRKDDPQFKS